MNAACSLADWRRAAPGSRVLASPFDYPTLESWGEAAARTMEHALGADHSTFTIRQNGRLHVAASGIQMDALSAYFMQQLPAAERAWGMESRQVALGAWNRATVWGNRLDGMYRSAYWHELIVPNRAFDTIGLTVATGHADVAHFQFYHERASGRKFGDRGLAVLRTVYGAFAAGVRSWAALSTYHEELGQFVDVVPSALAVATMDGRIVHRNSALERLLDADPDRASVTEAILDAARRAAHDVGRAMSDAAAGRGPRSGPADGARLSHEVHGYRLSACALNTSLLSSAGALLVVVERVGPPLLPASLLQRRYGLTARESEVANLLMTGLGNAAIAARIHVSEHTARHHTEKVMAKLRLRSRAEIATLVASLAGR